MDERELWVRFHRNMDRLVKNAHELGFPPEVGDDVERIRARIALAPRVALRPELRITSSLSSLKPGLVVVVGEDHFVALEAQEQLIRAGLHLVSAEADLYMSGVVHLVQAGSREPRFVVHVRERHRLVADGIDSHSLETEHQYEFFGYVGPAAASAATAQH